MTYISKRRYILPGIFFILIGLLTVAVSIPNLMIPGSDPLRQVDGLLHLSVGTKSKADDYVVQIYNNGYTENIVCISSQISHDLFPSDYTLINLKNRGIPSDRIESLHLPIFECPVEVIDYLAQYCQKRHWRSVLVVTSPEGNRRGRRLMSDEFRKRGVDLYFTHSPEDERELRTDWWRTHWKIQRLIGSASDLLLDIYFGDCRLAKS